jgi:hypothetical protein
MLAGGVLTSITMSQAVFDSFQAYNSSGVVFDMDETLDDARGELYRHAVFCYGWWDNPKDQEDGYWLCKNRRSRVADASCEQHSMPLQASYANCSSKHLQRTVDPMHKTAGFSRPHPNTIASSTLPRCFQPGCDSQQWLRFSQEDALARLVAVFLHVQLEHKLGPQRLFQDCIWSSL